VFHATSEMPVLLFQKKTPPFSKAPGISSIKKDVKNDVMA
jgi:hypothetical protein